MHKLTQQFRNPLFEQKEQYAEVSLIVNYITRNKHKHTSYFYYFTLCEISNFVNVIMQIYLVDEFLGGTFTTYGLDVLDYVQMDQESRVDPMVRVFPRMTKCSFHRFGASGDVQKYDALCILPLNIINEKIYIVMWFWFVFLAIVTGLWLIYRLLTFSQSNVREMVLKRRASLVNQKQLRYVLQSLSTGDWFLLSMMCKNIDSQWFRELMKALNDKLKELEAKSKKTSRQNGIRSKPRANNFKAPDSGKERMITDDDAETDSESDSSGDEYELEVRNPSNDRGSGELREVVTSSLDGDKK